MQVFPYVMAKYAMKLTAHVRIYVGKTVTTVETRNITRDLNG
jgi:hypothetical protein